MIYSLREVKSYFSSKYEPEIAAIETEEGIAIPRLQEIVTGEDLTRQYPAVLIHAVGSDPQYDNTESPYPIISEEHEIALQVVMDGNNQEVIERDLLFYREAIKRLIKKDFTFGGAFNRVLLGRTNYSDMYQFEKQQKFLKICAVTLRCRRM